MRWLDRGYAGDMAYMARDPFRRVDPARLVPGARSVICLAMPYPPSPAPGSAPGPFGQIAAFAQGPDYHPEIQKRLRTLWKDFLQWAPAAVGRYYVDTGPVLERELAQRAGLGWCGKSTCLINRQLGSFFFLAEIITDAELDYDEPAVDHCGACRACVDACPTGALVAPHVVDARRCIAYLTIEHRGSIPHELRPALGTWIFGCDVCQQVCPWNRRAAFRPETRPAVPTPFPVRDLIQLMGLDQEEFSHIFRGTSIKRAKRRGLLRNVAVALGNWGDDRAVPVLQQSLEDPEPLVRSHSAWALGRIGGRQARAALALAREREENAQVLEEIVRALDTARTN